MGREVRRIKAGWEHPTDGTYADGSPQYRPLFDRSYSEAAADWDEGAAQWDAGFVEDYGLENPGRAWKQKPTEYEGTSYSEYAGERPKPDDYMPEWEEGEATKLVMYEDTSEGTPISPPFDTPEELAQWLTDNNASAFGGMTATYEQWLAAARGGWAPSMVLQGGVMKSGVEAMADRVEDAS